MTDTAHADRYTPVEVAPLPADVHAIVHTHFDREWYEQRWSYLARLITQVDRLLDMMVEEPSFAATLDGQSILIHDYLGVAPARATELRQRIEEGRLAVGPWWVLADLMIPTGETMLRNLGIGIREARSAGSASVVGYVPDMFGLPAQTPQVLQLAGLDFCVTWRGFGVDVPLEHIWEAPDGSTVVTSLLAPLAYAMAADFLDAPYDKPLDTVVRYAAAGRPSGQVPLMLGGDHWLPTQPTIDAVRAAGYQWTTVDGLRRAVLERTANGSLLELNRGEAYSNGHTLILPGVLSARAPLRRANKLVEHSLITHEAFIAALGTAGPSSSAARVDALWRYWLENTAHDSICGCSTDEVHKHTEVRVSETSAGLGGLSREASKAAIGQEGLRVNRIWVRDFSLDANDDLGVHEFGAFTLDRLGGGRLTLDWLHLAKPVHQVILRSSDGSEIPARVRPRRSYDDSGHREDSHSVYQHTVEAFLPSGTSAPLALTTLSVEPVADSVATQWESGSSIADGHTRVEVTSQGALTITDLATGHVLPGAFTVRDVADRGDSYDFDPLPRDIAVTGLREIKTRVCRDPLGARLEISGLLTTPRSLNDDRASRTPYLVDNAVTIDVLLPHATPGEVHVEVTVDNRAEDHRLRVVIPTGIKTPTSKADAAFMMMERAIEDTELDRVARGEIEQGALDGTSQSNFPVEGFVAVTDGERIVCVAVDGISEFQAVHDGAGNAEIELTVLRAFGFLSRYDLRCRRWEAGPPVPTPGGQIPGPVTQRFTVKIAGAGWSDSDSADLARRLQRPVVTTTPREAGTVVGRPAPFTLTGATLSAVVPGFDPRQRTAHIVNFSDEATTATFSALDEDASRGASLVGVAGDPISTLTLEGGQVNVELRPWQIALVRLGPSD